MPMEYQNLDEVMDFIRKSHATFGFHVQGESGQSIGEECCEAGAQTIHSIGISEQRGGKTGAWPANSTDPPKSGGPSYAARKRRAYGHTIVNARTNDGPGSMLSLESLKGVPAVTPHQVDWKYGLQRPPTAGVVWRDDLRRTDEQKAGYAHEQKRNFFELGTEVIQAIGRVIFAGFRAHMERQSWK